MILLQLMTSFLCPVSFWLNSISAQSLYIEHCWNFSWLSVLTKNFSCSLALMTVVLQNRICIVSPFWWKIFFFTLTWKSRIFRSTLSDMVMLTCTKVCKWFLKYPFKQLTLSINLRAFNLKIERYTNLQFSIIIKLSVWHNNLKQACFVTVVWWKPAEPGFSWLVIYLGRRETNPLTQITQCCGFRKNTLLCLIFIEHKIAPRCHNAIPQWTLKPKRSKRIIIP